MVDISQLIIEVKKEGYSEDLAEAKVSQDIILLLLAKSRFNKNITIKGGVVMRSISQSTRRATIDIDLDLIKFPLTDKSIKDLMQELDGIEGVRIKIVGKIEELKHQDYRGKRVFVEITDSFDIHLLSKIDIGVHKYFELGQVEYCFDVCLSEDSVSLLINSKEQMFSEKLKSLLRFGILSTRFKDVFDMYYLIDLLDKNKLLHCFDVLIFQDATIKIKSIEDIVNKLNTIFDSKTYLSNLDTTDKNWIGIDNKIVLKTIMHYISNLN